MDFRGNTFAVQGQGTIYVYLEEKIHRKNFCASSKNHESLARLQYSSYCPALFMVLL